MGPIFCPKCHREAYRLREGDGNVEVIQSGKVLVNVGLSSSVSMSVSCPSGHPVKLKLEASDGSPTP